MPLTVTMFTSPEVLFPLAEPLVPVLFMCLTSLYDGGLTHLISACGAGARQSYRWWKLKR